jgi:chromate reductase
VSFIDAESDAPDVRRILCLAGSLRRRSWNRLLLQGAANFAPSGLNLRLYDELDCVPPFNEDLENLPPASVQSLRREVSKADGILIATPEYNHSFPGVLKNVIDWLSRGSHSVLAGKPTAVIGASAGNWGTRLAQAALRQVLVATEARLLPAPMLYVARAEACFDPDGRLSDLKLQAALTQLIIAFEDWIVLHSHRD